MLVVLSLTLAPCSIEAAILSNVPMQGTMVMPMVSYDATAGRLHVSVDPMVPQLTPLLVSNPGDQFDPADPWFDSLDPGRQGLAFSRRYGFMMDENSDPLPDGAEIRIRKLSSSPALEFYRYRSSAPKSWEPIFGTAGSTNAMAWDGMMFHPGVAAPAGTNTYSAIFEAVLVDSGTGMDLAGTGSGPFELRWTSVPDGRPSLEVGYKVVVGWPVGAGWVLEASPTLSVAAWVTVTNTAILLDGQSAVVLPAAEGKKFYRMRRAP